MSVVRTYEDDFDDYDEDGGVCLECEGEGRIMACCDDLCHGSGQCMFESWEDPAAKAPPGCFITCRACKGSGET